jgi:tetratricopeptide (TPR) repeat protein
VDLLSALGHAEPPRAQYYLNMPTRYGQLRVDILSPDPEAASMDGPSGAGSAQARALVERALALARGGELAAAEERLLDIVRHYPYSHEAFGALSDVCTSLGRTQDAVYYGRQVVGLVPSYRNLTLLARALGQDGRLEEAATVQRHLWQIRAEAEPAEGLEAAQGYLVTLSRLDDARQMAQVCARALVEYPGDPTIQYQQAFANLLLGRYTEAYRLVEQALLTLPAGEPLVPRFRQLRDGIAAHLAGQGGDPAAAAGMAAGAGAAGEPAPQSAAEPVVPGAAATALPGAPDAGLGGSGLAGSGLAGSGLAGSGLAGSGLAGSGLAGSGLAGSGLAGSGSAGSALGGSAPGDSGLAGSGPAGPDQTGIGLSGSGLGTLGPAGSGLAAPGLAAPGLAAPGLAGSGPVAPGLADARLAGAGPAGAGLAGAGLAGESGEFAAVEVPAPAAAQGFGLAEVVAAIESGHLPPADGGLTVVPGEGRAAVLAFTGHTVVAADVEPEWIRGQLAAGDLSAPLNPPFLAALGERLGGRRVNNIDMVVIAPRLIGRPPVPLAEVDARQHPRVQRALRYRDEVHVWATEGGLLVLGRGLGGRWELAVEVEPEQRNRGLGRALAIAGRHLVPGSALWAQIAPGNSASVRAFLAAGFTPVGAEALLVD